MFAINEVGKVVVKELTTKQLAVLVIAALTVGGVYGFVIAKAIEEHKGPKKVQIEVDFDDDDVFASFLRDLTIRGIMDYVDIVRR